MMPAPGDAVALTRLLVRVDSRNPDLVPGAPAEGDAHGHGHGEEAGVRGEGRPIEAVARRDGRAAGEDVLGARVEVVGGRARAELGGSGAVGREAAVELEVGLEARGGPPGSADAHGRHTTTHRELFVLPSGAILIDTPGMREFGLYADDESRAIDSAALAQIESVAERCRFRDCTHEREPGCAVREAAEAGTLPADRLESFRKLKGELRHLAVRQDPAAQADQRRRWRTVHKAAKKHKPRG